MPAEKDRLINKRLIEVYSYLKPLKFPEFRFMPRRWYSADNDVFIEAKDCSALADELNFATEINR